MDQTWEPEESLYALNSLFSRLPLLTKCIFSAAAEEVLRDYIAQFRGRNSLFAPSGSDDDDDEYCAPGSPYKAAAGGGKKIGRR
jgi:hypothetical protein